MHLIRSPHFKSFVEGVTIKAYQKRQGLTEEQGRSKFNETFYDDFNLLHWIVESIYPHTFREGDKYFFVTDEIEHEVLPTHGVDKDYYKRQITQFKGNAGRMSVDVQDEYERVYFSNKGFTHGHVDKRTGKIGCYNNYNHFGYNITTIGFASALMEVYNFSRVSRYGTVFSEKVEA